MYPDTWLCAVLYMDNNLATIEHRGYIELEDPTYESAIRTVRKAYHPLVKERSVFIATNGIFFSESDMQGSDLMGVLGYPTCFLIARDSDWSTYVFNVRLEREQCYNSIMDIEMAESAKPEHIGYLLQAPYVTTKELKFDRELLLQGMYEELKEYIRTFKY